MIVADTNTLAYLIIPGTMNPQARAVYEKDDDWRAPDLWRSEFRNILWLMMRRESLSLDDAVSLMEDAEKALTPDIRSIPSETILRLASESGCTPYDCEFAALAVALGAPLVTSDQALLKAFPSFAVSPDGFAA